MILGYEQPVDIPMMSMYDKDMMKMYLGALQRDYEQGVADQKEFINKYGDFISPIAGASEAYYNEGVGKVMNVYNQLLDQGIDPIRSIQGRAALSRAMNSVDRAKMATIKESAKNREEYNKAVAQAKLAGKYDPELENIALRQAGIDPTQPWDHNKLWDRTAPEYYTSFSDTWAPIMKAVPKTTKETVDPKTGIKYHTEGVFEENLKPIVDLNYDRWANTPSGQLQLKHIKDVLRPQYPNDTEAQLSEKATEVAKTAAMNLGLQSSNPDVDKASLQTNAQKFEAGQKALDRALERWLYSSGGKGGSKNNTNNDNIFREADRRRNNSPMPGSGGFATYVPSDSPSLKIQPSEAGVKFIRDTKGNACYSMNTEQAKRCIKTEDGRTYYGAGYKTRYFYPTGQLENVNGTYYIYGTMSGDANNVYKMRVTEGDSNYGQKPNRQ